MPLRYLRNERTVIAELAARMYADEPCRICGVVLTYNDILDGAVFAGYSARNESRSAHKNCWAQSLPKTRWVYPEDERVDN